MIDTKLIKNSLETVYMKKGTERAVETLFEKLFTNSSLKTSASRTKVPKITAPAGVWTPDGVVEINNKKFVFELKSLSRKLAIKNSPNYNSDAYYQAVRYMVGSYAYESDMMYRDVFCFNGQDLIKVTSESEDAMKRFLQTNFWKSIESLSKNEIHKKLKERSDLIEAYFPASHISSIKYEMENFSEVIFKNHLNHFVENFMESIGEDIYSERKLITRKNLKPIYKEFSNLVINKPEEYFIKIAPIWTKHNIFHFRRNGFLYIFEKSGKEIARIEKENIKNKNIDSLERLIKSYALDSPETFYDNYDNLLPKKKRKELGSYFTKKGLAKFAQYFLIDELNKIADYHIIDPAAGSGTLVSGLRARSVFGSDIVEFKNSLMDERGVINSGESVDFLTTRPSEYSEKLNDTLGGIVDNPLLFISNPPYLGNQSRQELEESLQREIEYHNIKAHDLYVYFMVQMSRMFDIDHNGLGKDLDGYIGVFTPDTWITNGRGEQSEFRDYILSKFEFIKGFMVDGGKFFDNMNQPVLFSILKYRKDYVFKKNLSVSRELILNLTKSHKLINDFTSEWDAIPAAGKFNIEKKSQIVSKDKHLKYKKLEAKIKEQKSNYSLVEWIDQQPKFSQILSAAHSHSGGNQDALSTKTISENTKVLDIIKDFKSRLHLKESYDEISQKLKIVFDDRPKAVERGYRFLLEDKNRFPSQSISSYDGPLFNYFEELKKSHRVSCFYNAPPITTDVAVSALASKPSFKKDLFGNTLNISEGIKKLSSDSPAGTYLTKFEDEIGDYRSIYFIRRFMSFSQEFNSLVSNKEINSNLMWLPDINSNSRSNLKRLSALAFVHGVVGTEMKSFSIKYKKLEWSVYDYFKIDGWLKSSGLYKNIFLDNLKLLNNAELKLCKKLLSSKGKSVRSDLSELEGLSQYYFEASGFLPNRNAELVAA